MPRNVSTRFQSIYSLYSKSSNNYKLSVIEVFKIEIWITIIQI
nr:MAG TPA: hypothetical protein [Caudoviricetes sp.]